MKTRIELGSRGWMLAALAVIASTGGALAMAGCNAILGYEEAHVDQSLTNDGGGGGGDATMDASDGARPLDCDTYCALIMANCKGENLEYINVDTCKAMCVHFEPGRPDDTMQDSLACRIYHAGLAAANDPSIHCRHAGPVGGGTCGDQPCNPFCLLDHALCSGPDSPYDGGELGCRSECMSAPYRYLTDDAGDITLQSGDTLNCRIYHLESAYDPNNPVAKMTHCPHTGRVSATCQ
jgi:hypothetical protein